MKTPLSLTGLVVFLLSVTAVPSAPAASCCAETPAPESAYRRDSLYQMEGRFQTDQAETFALGRLRGRPVVLAMFYSSCRYACPLLLSDLMRLREALPAAERDQATYVLVSFDSAHDTPAVLHTFRESRQLNASWHLLHGDDEAVRELAALLGVKFVRERDGSFSHSNLITVLNREGEIVHQQTGLQAPVAGTAEVIHRLLAPVRAGS